MKKAKDQPESEPVERASLVGERIRKIRKEEGLSLEHFALRCDMNAAYVGHIERGVQNPTLNTLERICKGLDISVEDLFIDKSTTVDEEQEEGVSGHKVRAEARDKLQIIKEYARKGKFDILLVFMFDRIGRIADETPFVVEWFVRNGIRVWSTQEGEQRFDNHTDKLLNYIRFWQADGESEKTSVRTRTSLRQLVEEGHFKGGSAPYGYDLVKSGRINKRKHELYAETEKTAELMDNVSKLYEELISFSDLYDSASFEAKKMIVNQLIRRVDVYRGYQLNITFNFDLTPYIEGDDAAAC